jgi:hypothetical protein
MTTTPAVFMMAGSLIQGEEPMAHKPSNSNWTRGQLRSFVSALSVRSQ